MPPRRTTRKTIRFEAYRETIRANLKKRATAGGRLTLPVKPTAILAALAGLPVLLFCGLSLASFDIRDPAWSRSVFPQGLYNWGGTYGAYFADVAYYLFGFSALLLPAALCLPWWRGLAYLAADSPAQAPRYRFGMAAAGLALLMLAAPALEYTVLGDSLDKQLPIGAGGLAGRFLGAPDDPLRQPMTVLLSAAAAFGLLCVSQISLWHIIKTAAARTWAATLRLMRGGRTAYTRQTLKTGGIRRMTAKTKAITTTPVQPFSSAQCSRNRTPVLFRRPVPPSPPAQPPALAAAPYAPPPSELLPLPQSGAASADFETLRQTAHRIEHILAGFGIGAQVVSAIAGPVLTRYEIRPRQGIKSGQIARLSQELARMLSIGSVRISENAAGPDTAAIEVPNSRRRPVRLRAILSSHAADIPVKLLLALGQDVAGMPVTGDLDKMPNLLLAGMEGTGKATALHGMILSLIYRNTPENVRLAVIAPKQSDFQLYNRIPHMLCPAVSTPREAGHLLDWCVVEMEKRYRLLAHLKARDLNGYNAKIRAAAKKPLNPFSPDPDHPETLDTMPSIVLFVAELAELASGGAALRKQIEHLAADARAAGIHIVAATRYPDISVLSRSLKAAFPTRMAFAVSGKVESRIIIDQAGAEELLSEGDCLFLQAGHANPVRLQCAFVTVAEIRRIADYLRERAPACYLDGLLTGEAAERTIRAINPHAAKDELFDRAAELVIQSQKATISSLQRRLNIGYNRAANLLDALERAGIVSPDYGRGREVLAKTGSKSRATAA
ncbi:MAG: DNA translocase FtsK 4TM domain-containing protein [Neisseria sp.]|nr:DNA translocase FtsK 4TM domain-containing protein [Neisseria sp.]